MARSPKSLLNSPKQIFHLAYSSLKDKWHPHKEKIQYAFDKCMAAGFKAQIGLLALVMLIFVLLGAVLFKLTGIWDSPEEKLSSGEAIWKSLIHTIDTGTVTSDTNSDGEFRAVMLMVTFAGAIIMAGLISVINNLIQDSLTRSRKGRSQVNEEGHTLILGWSPAVFNVVRELIKANQKRSGAHKTKWRVVILADRDKVQMEDEIRAKLLKAKLQRHSKRVICRTGNPLDVDDLEIVKPRRAKSILILSPHGVDHDSNVIKTILAVQHTPKEKENKEKPYIVCGLDDAEKNETIIKLVKAVEAEADLGEIHWIDSSKVVARIIAQTSRQAGISEIYTDLLEYKGSHICFKTVKKPSLLVGKTFKEALLMLPNVVLIGIQKGGKKGNSQLNPLDREQQIIIEPGDRIIIIAASKTFANVESCEPVNKNAISKKETNGPKPERTLILGWNKRGNQIVNELNGYIEQDSVITVIADATDFDQTKLQSEKPPKYWIYFRKADPMNREVLNELNIDKFDHIIVLGDYNLPPQQADMNTLVTLLNLRDIKQKLGVDACSSLSIVSEMQIDSNRKLAENLRHNGFGGHDFIVSYKLISSYLTQISQREKLQVVFEELLKEEGMEIYLKPAGNYVKIDTERKVNFSTVVAAAAKRNECAIGYRIAEHCHNRESGYGVTINPPKSETVAFHEKDHIIVIAEKEWDETLAKGATFTESD